MADDSSIKHLKEENKHLKKENAELKRKLKQNISDNSKSSFSKIFRNTGLVVTSGLAVSLLIVGNIIFWAGRTVVETDKYVKVSTEVIAQPSVQRALSERATTAIFEQVDVTTLLSESLPGRTSLLADPLASQLQTYTEQTIEKGLASQQFQSFWQDSQETLHTRLISFIRNSQGDGVVSINDVFQRAVSNLADTRLSSLSKTKLPDSVGSVVVIDAGWLPTARNLLINLPVYRIMTIVLFLATSLLAVLLSRNKRRQIIILSLIFVATLFITFISVKAAQNQITNNAPLEYQVAVKDATSVIFSSLILQTRLLLASSMVIVLFAWLSGPYRSAAVIRKRLDILLAGKLHQSIFGSKENSLTIFVGRHKQTIFWAFVSISALYLVFSSISTTGLVAFLVSSAIVAVVVNTIGAPSKK